MASRSPRPQPPARRAPRAPRAATQLPQVERSGPPADLSEAQVGPPEEPGVSVEAAELAVQFLRDATEQYNLESEQGAALDPARSGFAEAQLVSDATLESANQADFPVPVSAALADEEAEVMLEPDALEIDLRSNSIVGASLFDQPAPVVADPELAQELDEQQDAEDFATTIAEPMRQPAVISDDPSEVDDARQQAIQRLLDERVKRRLRVAVLPKDRAAASDGSGDDSNDDSRVSK
jgi:hypothetical protein